MCSRVPPAPVYKGAKERGWPAKEGAPRGSPTPTGSRTPFFPSWRRRRGKRGGRGKGKGGRRPPSLVLFGLGRVGARGHLLPPFLFSLRAHVGPITPGGVPITPGTPVKSRFHPERFRYPNIGFQYIDLYVSTISRLLVMSMITSRTPNNLRYIKKYINS